LALRWHFERVFEPILQGDAGGRSGEAVWPVSLV
jgi:hypothetical protein